MADVILSAELQARVDSFVANLLRASNSASSTGTAVGAMSANISRNIANVNSLNLTAFNNALNAGTLSVQRLGQAVPSITRPLVVGTNQATNALTNLGRVAQDAPFGFIGIQNNLNPLLESFQRLRAETGSNGAALRALGQSLIGPAGLGIALSVVSSAITFYTMYQQKANKAVNDAKKNTDDYVNSLDQLTQAQVRGAQSAQKELTDLRILYSVYQNANLSLKDRKEAYLQIQEQYPEYFKNIKFEREASEETRKAYDTLTQSIIATGRARAAADLITKNSSRQLENEQKIADLEKQQLKNITEINKVRKADASFNAETGTGGAAPFAETKAQNAYKETLKAINDLKTDSNVLSQRNLQLVKAVNEEVKKGANVPGQGFGDKIKVDPNIEVGNRNVLPALPLNEFYVSLSSGITEINPTLKIKPTIIGVDELTQMIRDADDAIYNLTSLPGLVDVTSEALGSSFEAMGQAIAEGGNVLDAAGAVLAKSFAELLSALGQQFITMGAAKVAAGILASPFGGKLIADGAGLIALGAGLKIGGGLVGASVGKGKSSGNNVTAFASGGIVSGPTLGLMGEYAGAKSDPEVVAPLSKLKKMLGEVDGNGRAVSQSNQPNIVFEQSLGIDGDKLVAFIRKKEGQLNRQG